MAAVQTDFLRGITHDLQTPLTSIRAVANELQQSKGLDATGRADLETIAQQADRLRRMVGQLLAVSRLEVGALTPCRGLPGRAPSSDVGCAAGTSIGSWLRTMGRSTRWPTPIASSRSPGR
jgi:signal transduction histidine kinase